jgi:hypothetical protein|eukprot:COSAG01_NODE_2717_length_7194_cov_22.920366_2_plen_67_part_00
MWRVAFGATREKGVAFDCAWLGYERANNLCTFIYSLSLPSRLPPPHVGLSPSAAQRSGGTVRLVNG